METTAQLRARYSRLPGGDFLRGMCKSEVRQNGICTVLEEPHCRAAQHRQVRQLQRSAIVRGVIKLESPAGGKVPPAGNVLHSLYIWVVATVFRHFPKIDRLMTAVGPRLGQPQSQELVRTEVSAGGRQRKVFEETTLTAARVVGHPTHENGTVERTEAFNLPSATSRRQRFLRCSTINISPFFFVDTNEAGRGRSLRLAMQIINVSPCKL